ncbi:hypothetical protein RvVAR031_35850 [Agrobacterium vitis]|nr:hypothetical protein RvVAR031_35850 [Agrobacterium vitis]
MIEKRKKTAIINVRISPQLKDAAEKAAKADQRSLTSLIEKLLSDHISSDDGMHTSAKRNAG